MSAVAWSQNWLGKADTAPVSGSPYSPTLLEGLRTEQRLLYKRCAELEKAVLTGRFDALPHGLTALKAKFNVFVLRENLHCHRYLQRILGERPIDLARLARAQLDMEHIDRQVLEFIEAYRSSGVTRANAQEFLNGLRAMGQRLVQRAQSVEAELYPLYKP